MNWKLNHSMEQTKLEKKGGVWIQLLWVVFLLFGSELIGGFLLVAIENFQKNENSFIPSVAQLCLTGITTLIVLLFCKKIEHRRAQTLGFTKKKAGSNYLFGLLLGAIFMGGTFLLNMITQSIQVTNNLAQVNWMYILFAAIGFGIQGMSEEVVCRGYLMNSFASQKGVLFGALTNSILFSVLHLMNPGVTAISLLNIFLVGLFFSFLFYLTDNIWLVSAFHSIWNFLMGPILGVLVSGTSSYSSVLKTSFKPNLTLLNGGSFGFEGGLIVTFLFLLGCIWALLKIKKINQNQ